MRFLVCFMFIFSFNSHAFYLECKDVNDLKSDVRIFKNDKFTSNLFLNVQTHIGNTPLGVIFNIYSPKVIYKYPPKTNQVKNIEWEDPTRGLIMNIEISDTVLLDGRETVWPIPFKSQIEINSKDGDMKIINSSTFACREYSNF